MNLQIRNRRPSFLLLSFGVNVSKPLLAGVDSRDTGGNSVVVEWNKNEIYDSYETMCMPSRQSGDPSQNRHGLNHFDAVLARFFSSSKRMLLSDI